MNSIIMIGGGKGGVGKSTVAMALLDGLVQAGMAVVYVETDDSNPDVYKAVHELITSELINLDSEDGWHELGAIIDAHPQDCIVVNTAARATASILEHGYLLDGLASQLQRKLIMVWPLNRQRDGLELLNKFVNAGQHYAATYALLNTYFGPAEKFGRFKASKLKDRVTDFIVFPELHDLVADKIIDGRLALWNATEGLSVMDRLSLRKYRDKAKSALEMVYAD